MRKNKDLKVIEKEVKNYSEKYFKDAIRHYKNGKGILKRVEVKDGLYLDIKPVQEACGVTYLSVLKAIDGYLLQYGISVDKLPKSYEEYAKALSKLAIKDGKLKNNFIKAYYGLHILGYYRGTQDAEDVKLWFSYAKWILENVIGERL